MARNLLARKPILLQHPNPEERHHKQNADGDLEPFLQANTAVQRISAIGTISNEARPKTRLEKQEGGDIDMNDPRILRLIKQYFDMVRQRHDPHISRSNCSITTPDRILNSITSKKLFPYQLGGVQDLMDLERALGRTILAEDTGMSPLIKDKPRN